LNPFVSMMQVPSPLVKGPQGDRERKRVNHRFHR
jgi:hypothetical protein